MQLFGDYAQLLNSLCIDEYLTALDRTGGQLSTVFIENQYFQDPRIAQRLLGRWLINCAQREWPYAHDDPTRLLANSRVEITNSIDLDTGNIVPINRFRADQILTNSDISGYTLVKDEMTPIGSSPDKRQRNYFKNHGIYVHSKAAIFIEQSDGSDKSMPDSFWATVGSANINPRSLDDNGNQDSEANVWWTHEEKVQEYYKKLAAEHLNETDPDRVNSY